MRGLGPELGKALRVRVVVADRQGADVLARLFEVVDHRLHEAGQIPTQRSGSSASRIARRHTRVALQVGRPSARIAAVQEDPVVGIEAIPGRGLMWFAVRACGSDRDDDAEPSGRPGLRSGTEALGIGHG